MKIRLGIFIMALVLLPLAGWLLSGQEWSEIFIGVSAISPSATRQSATGMPATESTTAILRTALMLLGYVLIINYLIKKQTGNSPMNTQRGYYLWMAVASATLVWLLVYLNLFTASWTTQSGNSTLQLLLYSALYALLAPAVLNTRALLGTLPGLLQRLAHGVTLPVISDETVVYSLMPLAVLGLLGGAAWPQHLFWLLWIAPLLLLVALQLLWNESTIFSGLKSGDWGRIICAALAGMIVGNLSVLSYLVSGGKLIINLHALFAQLGYGVFGLLCLQLGDVVAENWRGKKRGELFQQKKKFPIPVVVKKS
jgi:hypothetical protein